MGVHAGYAPGQATAGGRSRGRRSREGKATEGRPQELRPQELRPQFRLRRGRDDLLIEWLASLAPRRRSAAIRKALREHLAARETEDDGGGWPEDPDLAAALDALF